jgi:hypothetical protein
MQPLSKIEIIIYSLSLGWAIACLITPRLNYIYHIRRYGKWSYLDKPPKPFSCLKCMTGWSALILSFFNNYGTESFLLLFVGLFAGGIFESIMTRYL